MMRNLWSIFIMLLNWLDAQFLLQALNLFQDLSEVHFQAVF
jgi:hypothetical protein